VHVVVPAGNFKCVHVTTSYEEASGDLNLHLNVLVRREVKVKINGATILSKKIDEGEHWEKIDIPTGMIDEGTNRLTISFPGYSDGIAMLADSKINIIRTYLTFSHSPENPIIIPPKSQTYRTVSQPTGVSQA
jgi:hypothetical protein